MAIGDLYDVNNVVVGQAAVFVAAPYTPLPSLANFNVADPFDPTMWTDYVFGSGSATNVTFTFVRRGVTVTTSSLAVSGLTAAAIASALNTAIAANQILAAAGYNGLPVVVTGTTPNFIISIDEALEDGVLTKTDTGGVSTLSSSQAWVAAGGTEQGWQFGTDKSTQTINIEEQSTAVGMTISSQAVTLQGSLSEDISRTLAIAENATVTKVAPTSTLPGYDNVVLTDTVLTYAVAAVTQNATGLGRIIYLPACTSLGNVSASFRRAAGQRLYAVNFATVCPTTSIQTIDITQPHS